MTQKERLTELITEGGKIATQKVHNEIRSIVSKTHKYSSKNDNTSSLQELTADYLLNNGVIVLPCKVGDTVYTNIATLGDYLRKKDRPYACEVVFIGLNTSEEHGGGFINVKYHGCVFDFRFSDIGKAVFLTKEAAEKASKESEEKMTDLKKCKK